jgi:diacylglycerol kinase family enzyme
VSLGRVNGRYFLFHVGIGYDAAVVEQVERRGTLKRYAGQPLFVYAAFATWWGGYDRRRPHFRVEIPGQEPVTNGYFAMCLKSNPYTFLRDRPLDLAPGTGPDTGLSMVTFRSMALPSLLRLAASALRGGRRLGDHPAVEVVRDPPEVVVVGYAPVPYQVDGDYLGTAERLELQAVPNALRLVIP